LYQGNIDALRDWCHAKDSVRMQWIMLQQETADDFVIAMEKQTSVREFVRLSAKELGVELKFTGKGLVEISTVESITGYNTIALNVGNVIVRVEPWYFRPAEVETLLGAPSKAKNIRLGTTNYG
jgi:GDPmannose 4,6-dehydratase